MYPYQTYPQTHNRPYAYGSSAYESFDPQAALEPLLRNLGEYDQLRVRLEQRGGRIKDLERLTAILSKKMSIKGRYQAHTVSLVEREKIRGLFHDLGVWDLHLDVRFLDSRMPVYYICRTSRDYWSAYSLVVEDFYQSPGFPLSDERLVKLMQGGHEEYFLRLSPFRNKVSLSMTKETSQRRELDEILYRVGRHVFQAAWNEDQQIGMAVARHFGLPSFGQSIELLYLCLSGDLCELRSAIDDPMLHFFKEAYPQPTIQSLLLMLPHLDGTALTDLPPKALKLYIRLSRAFNHLLDFRVAWGSRKMEQPLYKLIFGNFSRLEQVARELTGDPGVRHAALMLEKESEQIIRELVRVRNSK